MTTQNISMRFMSGINNMNSNKKSRNFGDRGIPNMNSATNPL